MPTLNSHSRLLLIGIILIFSINLYGSNSDIIFRRITINDGLSLSSVYAIYQDSKGFMWFATEDGLNKYDGESFTIYNQKPGESNSLADKWIETILEDNKGNIWLGSRHGLTRLDPTSDKMLQYHQDGLAGHQLINDTIVSLAYSDGYIWVGTMKGLNRINSETLVSEPIDLNCNVNSWKVYFFHTDEKGRTWIGTDGGLYVKYPGKDNLDCVVSSLPDNEQLEVHSIYSSGDTLWVGSQESILKYILEENLKVSFKYPAIQFPTNSEVEFIYKDTHQNLWIQTVRALNRFSNKQLIPVIETPHTSPTLAINPRKPLIEDSEGNLWFGTFGDGVYKISVSNLQIIHLLYDPSNPVSLSDNTINYIFEDRANGIWFGTFGAGISVYDPNSNIIKTLRHNAFNPSSMSSSFVWSIQEDKKGNVWIGTNNTGINIYNPANESFKFFTHDPAIPGSLQTGAVRELFMTRKGVIWVGTDGGGLSKYNPQNNHFQTFTNNPADPSSISSNSVRTIYEDSTGILWIGTRNGLNRFNPTSGKFRSYMHDPTDENSISNNFIYSAIYMDKKGILWIGTYGGGLNKMDTRTGMFTHYQFDPKDPSSISDDIVFAIYEDEKGYFWIGTNSGLNLFNPSTGKFKRYGMESGLPNEVIYGIVPDKNNRLWITTNKGISRLDLTEFRFKNFDVSDGLQSNEFNGGAFHKGLSGNIYAGGVYGLSIIDPDMIVSQANNAELIISRLEILGKDVKVMQDGMYIDSAQKTDALVELVENYYLPKHVTYLDVVRLNYQQRYFSIEFAALNHHMPEKLNYRYRLQNLEDHWNNAGSRNYVTYANLKPGTYIFEVDASNTDGNLTENPAQLKIIITPPFWRSYWFMLILVMLVLLIIVFIYRYLLNERTNLILKEQYEQIRAANNQLQISESNLKELNATKDKFFSIISHDLKNPFASVLSISALIDENFDLTNPEELKYGVSKIHKTNKHIYELLENLLTWSKTQRGNISMDKVKFNISKIIETNINILKLSAEKKNISIINHNGEDQYAFADREMISTVFRNLLNNAVKFTPPGKKVNITTEIARKMITVKVADEGVGISTDDLHKLFRIENKVKTEGTDGEKGTGLGLVICKEFIEKNDGIIDVSSSLGKGSTFSFTIPLGE